MLVEKIKLYDQRDDVTLTTYILDDSREMLDGKKRPCVLICPGGGYMSCSDREAEPIALRFASMGYHAFVLRYSVYGGFPKEDDIDENIRSKYPQPMRDIGKAFITIHENADKWLVDTDKIALCGFSAGGHNCAMYSVYWQDDIISEHFGMDKEIFRPSAAIIGYAVCDYHLIRQSKMNEMDASIRHAATIAYFGTKNPSKDMLDTASVNLHVSTDTPPMFLWATSEDTLVPVENSTRMATALAAKRVPFEMHIFENGPHGLSLANQASAGSKFELNEDAHKWVDLCECWLKKRFELSLREKPVWMENK